MTYYAVVRIDDGVLTYCGRSEVQAAVELLAGTCYGKGESRNVAKAEAHKWATWFKTAPERMGLTRSVA